MSVRVRLAESCLEPIEELGVLLDEAAEDGAVVSFVGIARSTAKDGGRVDKLVLEPHPTLTRQSLEDIAAAAAQRFEVSHVHVVHRCGEMRPGEAIVFAAASAAHRRAAFECADYLMDRLKTEAVFWKREVGENGSEWIEPTDTDYADNSLWS
jgi:molybdopterin synthase catalytic subunit